MTTAWHNKDKLPASMVNSNFKTLKESDHFSALDECISKTIEVKSLLDLGCGIGEVGRVFTSFQYTGADLPHIVEGVSKIKNPHQGYIKFDIEKDDLSFLGGYDIILMNSFISEIPNWYLALTKVVFNSKKYVVLHRQSITKEKSKLVEYKTYGGLSTTNSVINYGDLIELFEKNGFEKIYETDSFRYKSDFKSFVFKKK